MLIITTDNAANETVVTTHGLVNREVRIDQNLYTVAGWYRTNAFDGSPEFIVARDFNARSFASMKNALKAAEKYLNSHKEKE